MVRCREISADIQDVISQSAHLPYFKSEQMCTLIYKPLISRYVKTKVHHEVNSLTGILGLAARISLKNRNPVDPLWQELQEFAGKLRELTSLAPHHIDVGEDALAEELVAKVREAVGVEVQIGLVYLVDVSGKDYLGALSGAGDDGLDLVRGEVLGLVYDEEDVAEAAAADIGQRVDYQFFAP